MHHSPHPPTRGRGPLLLNLNEILFFTGRKTAAELNGCFADNIKVQYLQFMAHMKTPQYRSNLQQLLEQEKVRADTAFGTLLAVLTHRVIFVTFCNCGPRFLTCVFGFLRAAKAQGPVGAGGAAPLRLPGSQRQDQRSLSGQAGWGEALLLYCTVVSQSILCVLLLHNKRSQKNLHQLLICGYVISFNSLDLWPCFWIVLLSLLPI